MPFVARNIPAPSQLLPNGSVFELGTYDRDKILDACDENTMIGLVEQTMNLSLAASSAFEKIINSTFEFNGRINSLINRVENVHQAIPGFEKLIESMPQEQLYSNTNVKHVADSTETSQLLSTKSRPHFVSESYEACAEPPDFSSADKTRTDDLTCLSLYSNPGFFLDQWIAEMMKEREQAKKKRRERRERRQEGRSTVTVDKSGQKKPKAVQRVRYDPHTGEKIIETVQVTESPSAPVVTNSPQPSAIQHSPSVQHTSGPPPVINTQTQPQPQAQPEPTKVTQDSKSASRNSKSDKHSKRSKKDKKEKNLTIGRDKKHRRSSSSSGTSKSKSGSKSRSSFETSVPPNEVATKTPTQQPPAMPTGGPPPVPNQQPPAVPTGQPPAMPAGGPPSTPDTSSLPPAAPQDLGLPPPTPQPTTLPPAVPSAPLPPAAPAAPSMPAAPLAPMPPAAPSGGLAGALGNAALSPVKPVEKPVDVRSGLLQQIRAGKQLNTVKEEEINEVKKPDEQDTTVAAILGRRIAVADSDSDDSDELSDDWSD